MTKEAAKEATIVAINDKKGIHGTYYSHVEAECICGNKFEVSTTIKGPIKLEICYDCHPVYNKDKAIKKVIKGRLEKFLEKEKKIKQINK
ncbi:50S ribosomal protein L31 [bacterium]|nr:50S ribosomal protein L31 [bacterium]